MRVQVLAFGSVGTGPTAEYVRGDNEIPVQELLVSILRSGDVFVDVGANVGFFSILAARIVGPGGSVIAIEPLEPLARAIQEAAKLNHVEVSVVRAAAGDGTGDRIALWTARPGGASTSGSDIPPDVTGQLLVPAVSLDELHRGGRLGDPTLVKIDVEGAELSVLEERAACWRSRHLP